jgi:alpha-galactosidase
MDFGLWIEPEMVSPQSELARAHPDWCLHAGRAERPTQRHQLVLDLTRSEVRNYLFEAIDRLLRGNAIAYLKWDHNRDLFPAMSHGRPAGHWQTLAYYDLLDRIRRAHPEVEIESCASGGARVDFALAGRAARFWTSDNTDPVERLRIQRAMSLFYPLEVIGSHVGAAPNPTTGRSTAMLFRARAAIFGHFGVEADPGRLDDEERSILRAHAELYKQHRRLLLRGRLSYGDCSDPDVSIAIVSSADGSEALALVTRTTHSRTAVGPPVRFPGLREEGRYRVRLLEPWPARSAERFEDEEFWRAEPVLDGATLGQVGVQLHLVRPDTAWLIHLQAERGSRG